ncbi:hypothetical protein ACLBVL_26585, partial [Pseudomonas aeruginosa]
MTGRIIVADDHPLFREGMLSILQRLLPEARIEEAGDLAGVLRLAGEGEQPDSLILDLRFPGLTRIEMLACGEVTVLTHAKRGRDRPE